ncbi:hypothetical protein D3C73_1233800 [compost metagenome]
MTTAKTIVLMAKTRDACNVQVLDNDGDRIYHIDGDYVPYGFGIGGGDYLELTIDIETGKVVGWNPETFKKAFEERLQKDIDEDTFD